MPEVTIMRQDATTITVEVDTEEETVASIKVKISGKDGTPTDLQQLSFQGQHLLEEPRKLSSYGIVPDSVIHIRESPLEIPVTVTSVASETLTLRMSPDDTTRDVKKRLEEELGIDAGQIQLNCQRQESPDDRPLYQNPTYTHRGGVTFHMDVRVRVRLRSPEGRLTGPVEISIENHVSVLHNLAHVHCRIPPHLQCLRYDGRHVDNYHRIGYYSIPNNAIIDVELRDYELMVFLKTLTGQTITIRVTPRDTVGDVKQKIFEQEGIPVDRQRMIFIGEQLNDNDRLLDHRIEHESAVHLVFRSGQGFQIFVRSRNNRTMVFECQPTTTIERIKEKVRERERLHIDIQRLTFEGRVLENNSTVQECGLKHNSTVDLTLEEGRNTQIFISLPENEVLSVWVNVEHTVAQLKQQISERKNVPTNVQDIFFARAKLDDERTLQSYVIEENHMLHLHIVTPLILSLTIQFRSGRTIQLQEPSNKTVMGLKQVISQREGLPSEHQVLFHKGKELDHEYRKLIDLNIQSGDTIVLDVVKPVTETVVSSGGSSAPTRRVSANYDNDRPKGLLLFVKTLTGKTITLNVSVSDTVADLKQKILEKEKIPVSQQCLIAAGKPLADNDDIHTIGVQNHSVLHLVLRVPSRSPLSLLVQTPTGQSLTVNSNIADTVSQIKETIETENGIAADKQVLLYDGTILQGERTLGSYSIPDGTRLQLQMSESE
jgi:ubiquitin C